MTTDSRIIFFALKNCSLVLLSTYSGSILSFINKQLRTLRDWVVNFSLFLIMFLFFFFNCSGVWSSFKFSEVANRPLIFGALCIYLWKDLYLTIQYLHLFHEVYRAKVPLHFSFKAFYQYYSKFIFTLVKHCNVYSIC